MRPDVVTFWQGPLDRLRQTCLRSQLAAGHKVTVYSFEPLAGLPAGVGNAEAEAILPHAFSEKLRPPEPDGSWRDWTTLQFSDFFRMRLMAQGAGLWLDADVLLLKPVEIDPAKPFFACERPRQLGNSVLYLPPHDPSSRRSKTDGAGRAEPDWLALRHRLILGCASCAANRIGRRHSRRDLRSGGTDRAGPRRNGSHSLRCRKNRFTPCTRSRSCFSSPPISKLIADPTSRVFTSRQKAAATSRRSPAACMRGPRSGLGPDPSLRGCAPHFDPAQ